MSQLQIQTKKPKFETAKNLYGIFFEDINRAGEGGLYPERLRNRSFEDSLLPGGYAEAGDGVHVVTDSGWEDEFNGGEGLSRWMEANGTKKTPIPAWYAEDAQMELERQDTLNANRSAALRVRFAAGGCVYNTGFCGVPVKAGESSVFYMFAKAKEPAVLELSLEKDGQKYAVCSLCVDAKEYARYDAVLTVREGGVCEENGGRAGDACGAAAYEENGGRAGALCGAGPVPADCGDAVFAIRCPEGGEVEFGFVSLMPEKTWMGHGLRTDLVEKLKDLHPRFLRFPGGCIVEGTTPSTVMRFRNTVGPVWERPGQLLVWHYRSGNGLGFHEYLQLCEDLDMEPMYVCNCGMTCQARNSVLLEGEALEEALQDALDAIEYAVGPAESRWGSLRAKMGHPEPFRLTWLEIGNENHGPDYEARYRMFYREIKARWPQMKIVANTHVEEQGCPAEWVDEHFYNTTEFFAENLHYYDGYDRKGPEIFIGEQAVNEGPWLSRLYGALGEAAFLIGMERNQDVVTLSSYAPLLEHVRYSSWAPNLIRFDNQKSLGIPTYYVWKMFGQNRGDRVLESTESAGKIYRPFRGMASLKAEGPLSFRNAAFCGSPAEVTHELAGHAEPQGEGFLLTPSDEERQEEFPDRMSRAGKSFVVFGEEDQTCGRFEADIWAEEGQRFALGAFSARKVLPYYNQLLEGAEKVWTPAGVQPLWWKFEAAGDAENRCKAQEGAVFDCWLEESAFPENRRLTEKFAVTLESGGYHRFGYETDGRVLRLLVDGEIVREEELPCSPSFASVSTETESEIIVKLVNLAGETDPVRITLDCPVETAYTVVVMTGEKGAQNSFEEPEHVRDHSFLAKGAAEQFVYEAPAYSVSVLRLKKRRLQSEMRAGHRAVMRNLEECAMGKKQAFNPYLPSWEYIPDGEPYVFGDRVYVYGSHDFYNGYVFCMGDYVCWSAPVDDPGNWRYEGVIYPRSEDPLNREGKMCLYAPDVTVGPDGRYYLYYVLDHVSVVSVAVCDTPAGRYEFYGYVHDESGARLGERPGDEPQFDPGVLTEGDRTYLYTGFCGRGDKSRHGAMATALGPDMLTIAEEPVFVAPGCEYEEGTGFEGHAFFEAPSIRKIGSRYYFIYSSTVMHELCYAVSDSPTEGFSYGGVLVSNCDLHIDTYKPAGMPAAYGANNHGSIVEIGGEWYIFYHRHTNGTWYSRQGCAERLTVLPDGTIPQAEITSCGLNGGPLEGKGEYPAYIACHLFTDTPSVYVGDNRFPKVMQDGRDGDEEPGYVANIQDSATVGFKYFDCRDVREIRIRVRGYGDGVFEVRTAWDGEILGSLKVEYANVWEEYAAPVRIPDGVQAIYLTYRGKGNVSLLSFALL